MFRATPHFKFGVEWNAAADEVGIVANWRALDERRWRPAIVVGTSSDRIGTPHGQAYFVTASKSLLAETGLPVAPYAGLSYSGFEDRLLVPFGLNVVLPRGFSAMLINDGVHTHLSASYGRRNLSLTLLAVERRDLGLTVGLTF
jgi:hypothetical protein